MDTLSNTEAKLFLALGNEKSKGIWEEALGSNHEKLDESDSRDKREKWIKSKYLKKEFLTTSESMKDARLVNLELYTAAQQGDLMGVATALARGANVDWRNDQDVGRTPLHALAICPRPDSEEDWMGIECAELLLQNGANMKVLDHSSHNVLDCAVLGSADRHMLEYLSQKFE